MSTKRRNRSAKAEPLENVNHGTRAAEGSGPSTDIGPKENGTNANSSAISPVAVGVDLVITAASEDVNNAAASYRDAIRQWGEARQPVAEARGEDRATATDDVAKPTYLGRYEILQRSKEEFERYGVLIDVMLVMAMTVHTELGNTTGHTRQTQLSRLQRKTVRKRCRRVVENYCKDVDENLKEVSKLRDRVLESLRAVIERSVEVARLESRLKEFALQGLIETTSEDDTANEGEERTGPLTVSGGEGEQQTEKQTQTGATALATNESQADKQLVAASPANALTDGEIWAERKPRIEGAQMLSGMMKIYGVLEYTLKSHVDKLRAMLRSGRQLADAEDGVMHVQMMRDELMRQACRMDYLFTSFSEQFPEYPLQRSPYPGTLTQPPTRTPPLSSPGSPAQVSESPAGGIPKAASPKKRRQ